MKASKLGVARANYNLGLMSWSGDSVPVSDHRALGYFKKAAKQGHLAANLEIARICPDKNSKCQNRKMGLVYKRKALKIGFIEAREFE